LFESFNLCAQNISGHQKDADSETLMKEAIAHFDGSRYEKCLDALNQAIQINHNGELSDILYYYRALTNLKLEKDLIALSDLDTAIYFNDQKLNYLSLRVDLNIRLMNLDNASLDIEKILAKDSNNEAALLNKGIILQEKGEIQNALNLYTSVIKINPKNAEALYFRGMIYLQNLMADKGCLDLESSSDLNFKPAIEALKRYCK
jgi:tetratricopeptide (TPR) repeat protein